jgi:hypothetical protein
MSGLKPWVANPAADSPFQVAFPQASVTHPDRGVTVESPTPGRYETTVPTKSGGAGELKVFAGGTKVPSNQHSQTTPPLSSTANPPSLAGQKGRKGKGTPLRGPRTVSP